MYRKNLKVSVLFILIGVIVAALSVTMVVVVVLWYQFSVNHQIYRVQDMVVNLSSVMANDLDASRGEDVEELVRLLTSAVGDECLFIQNNRTPDKLSLDDTTLNADFSSIDCDGGDEKSGWCIGKRNGEWSFFGIGPKYTVMNYHLGQGVEIQILLDTVSTFNEIVGQVKVVVFYITLNSLFFATIAFFRLDMLIFKPVDKLVSSAESYRPDHDMLMFPDQSSNVFSQLSQSVNSMLITIDQDREKLRRNVRFLAEAKNKLETLQEEIVRTEKLAATGRLAAGLAHEIGNPITIVKGYLDLVADGCGEPEEREQFIDRSIRELDRIDHTIRRLLMFAREESFENEEFNLNEVVADVVDFAKTSIEKASVELVVVLCRGSAMIYGDQQSLRQVILNLLLNSLDAIKNCTRPGKIFVIVGSSSETGNGERFIVSVADNGTGIEEKDLKLIFEPFFTTKEPGEGTGLGLAVSYKAIKAFGGKIDVVSERNVGTLFEIILPGKARGNQ